MKKIWSKKRFQVSPLPSLTCMDMVVHVVDFCFVKMRFIPQSLFWICDRLEPLEQSRERFLIWCPTLLPFANTFVVLGNISKNRWILKKMVCFAVFLLAGKQIQCPLSLNAPWHRGYGYPHRIVTKNVTPGDNVTSCHPGWLGRSGENQLQNWPFCSHSQINAYYVVQCTFAL